MSYIQTSDTSERGGSPVQALIPGLETLHPQRSNTSLFGGVPSTKPSNSFRLQPGRCPAPAADLASSNLLDYLPSSQVGPPGKG